MRVKVIGCGLIGTSIALRLKELGESIWLEDKNAENLALANDLIGNQDPEPETFDLIIIATPISEIFNILRNLKKFNKESTVIDIGGLKSKLLLEVKQLKDIAPLFVSAHPMAGREFSGPSNSRADLFEGRAWLISKTTLTTPKSLDEAKKITEHPRMKVNPAMIGIACSTLDQDHDGFLTFEEFRKLRDLFGKKP